MYRICSITCFIMNDDNFNNSSIKTFITHDDKALFERDKDKEKYEFIENIKKYFSQLKEGILKGDNFEIYTALKLVIAKLKEEKTFDTTIEPSIIKENDLIESISILLSNGEIENQNIILTLKLISTLLARNVFSNETIDVLNEFNFIELISSKLTIKNEALLSEIINIFIEIIDSTPDRQNYVFSIITIDKLHELVNEINNEQVNISFTCFLYKLYQNIDFSSFSISISDLFNIANEYFIKTSSNQSKLYALWSIITLIKRTKEAILDDISHSFDFDIIYSIFNSLSKETLELISASIVFLIELLKINYDISFFDYDSLCFLLFSNPIEIQKDYFNLCFILSKYMEHFPSNIDKFLDIIRKFEIVYRENPYLIQKSVIYCVLALMSFVEFNDYDTFVFVDYFNVFEWISRGFETADNFIYNAAMKCLFKVFELANSSSNLDNCIELFNSHSLAETIDEIYDTDTDNQNLREMIDEFKSQYFS